MFNFKGFSIGSKNKVGVGNCTLIISIFALLINTSITGAVKATSLKQLSREQYFSRKLVAQNLESTTNTDYVALGEEILAEINRVRTNPQAYADWLEDRKQYFEGTVLKLPGEKPIRINRGKEALEEAIATLKNQEPLPKLSSISELANIAKEQITNITSFQTNLNLVDKTVSYGKYTAEGIVMQLVVDYGNRDRLNRQRILNPDVSLAGINCQANRQYDNICAIAIDGDSLETITENPEAQEFRQSFSGEANSEPNEIVITTREETLEEVNSEPNEIVVTTREETLEETTTNNEPEKYALSSLSTSNQSNNPSLLLEKIQQGKLEEGDTTIPNDGSFYDSYPLEGSAGDSFVISVESQDFDTFLAVMDTEGNILEQNDDISENNPNSRLKVTFPSNGVYNVIVNAYDEGGKGDYLLTVRR